MKYCCDWHFNQYNLQVFNRHEEVKSWNKTCLIFFHHVSWNIYRLTKWSNSWWFSCKLTDCFSPLLHNKCSRCCSPPLLNQTRLQSKQQPHLLNMQPLLCAVVFLWQFTALVQVVWRPLTPRDLIKYWIFIWFRSDLRQCECCFCCFHNKRSESHVREKESELV